MAKSLCVKGWRLQLCQGLRNLLNMVLRIDTFENPSNLALWIDDKGHAARQPIKGQRTVSSRDLLGWIGKERKVQFELPRKTLVRLAAVDADAKHLDVEWCQPFPLVSKVTGLTRASGRVILRVEIQHHPSAGIVAQENQVAVLVLQLELRRGIADLQRDLIEHFC